jgi:ketosteroid isomerase-like protein
MADQSPDLGKAFAHALARKDAAAVAALLDTEIDFRALTPNRAWEASGTDAVLEVLLGHWFEDSDEIEDVTSLDTDAVADCRRVAYRFHVRSPDGSFVVEQQAYYTERDGQITSMRVLCSGFRHAEPKRTPLRRFTPIRDPGRTIRFPALLASAARRLLAAW